MPLDQSPRSTISWTMAVTSRLAHPAPMSVPAQGLEAVVGGRWATVLMYVFAAKSTALPVSCPTMLSCGLS